MGMLHEYYTFKDAQRGHIEMVLWAEMDKEYVRVYLGK